MDNPNLAAALRLATLEIAIFPCAPDKKPRPGVRWKEEATTDEARIASWWRRWPDSLPAFEPGRHKLVAIDCDRHGKGDGVAALEELARANDEDPRDWPTVETPSTGRHVFFRQDGSLTNARGALPAGIDVRGTGGYVIAEGATLPDGRSYHAISDGIVDALEAGVVPSLPAWLADTIGKAPESPAPQMLGSNPSMPAPAPAPRAQASGQSEFFRKTNEAALHRLDDWVPGLFPRARYQPGTGAYRVSSRDLGRNLQEDLSFAPTGIVDFGVADMGDANQGKRTPIDVIMEHAGAPDAVAAARWLCEKLGLDAAAEWDASRADPNIDLSGLKPRGTTYAAPAEGEEEEEPEEEEEGEAPPIDEALTHMPGVLGETIDYIVDTARRPNRRLALAAALTICGTMLGRRMATPTGAGLQLYVITTYPTGGGKQHPLDCIDRLFRVTDLQRHIGPSQFMSMSALVRHAAASPLSICAQDEFGAMLKRLSHPRASGHELGISMVLRSIWGANFTTIRTPAYATTSSTDIAVPSLSLFGSTTAKELYDALRGQDVVNGFLNRFVIIDGGARVAEVEPRYDLRSVPDRLREGLLRLYQMGASGKGNLGFSCKNQANDPQPVRTQWATQDADDCYRDLSTRMQAMMDADPELEPFLPRVAENAVRCATIRACGESGYAPLVTLEHMRWAADLAEQSARRLINDAGKYMTDPLGAAEFERKLLAKVKMGGRLGIRMRELHMNMSRYQRYANDLNNTIESLKRSGVVVVEERRLPGGVSRRVRMA